MTALAILVLPSLAILQSRLLVIIGWKIGVPMAIGWCIGQLLAHLVL